MARKKIERNIYYDDTRSKFYVSLYFPGTESRKPKTKWVTVQNKKEARELLRQHEEGVEELLEIKEGITLSDWLDEWLDTVVAINREPTTVAGYRFITRHIKDYFGDTLLADIDTRQVQAYYLFKMDGEEGLSSNTVRKHHTLLKTAFKVAVKRSYIGHNPMDAVESPKYVKPDISVYNIEEIQKLYDSIKDHPVLEPVVYLAAELGLRREEILGLTYSKIDFDNMRIVIDQARVVVGKNVITKDTKNKSSTRTLAMSDTLMEVLLKAKKNHNEDKEKWKDIYHENDWVVCDELGEGINPGYLSSLFRKHVIKNDLPHITLHGLRHSVASIGNELGLSMFDISKLLGHSSIETTSSIYTTLFDQTQRAAIESISSAINKKKDE